MAPVFELSKVEHVHIREAVVGHLSNLDESLAQRVANGLAMDSLPAAPPPTAPVVDLLLFPATHIIKTMAQNFCA